MQHFFETIDNQRHSIDGEQAHMSYAMGQIEPVITTDFMTVWRSTDHAKLKQKLKPEPRLRFGGRFTNKMPNGYRGN